MNYYERHLGDYARNAGHLSMLEHGAYTLLLDRYYTTDQPIPKDQAYRLCRARSADEIEAVDAVLSEFFILEDACYRNRRADEELAKALVRIEAARGNGKKGGRPKASPIPEQTQQKPNWFSLGNPAETQLKANQAPSNHLSKKDQKPLVPQVARQTDAEFEVAWAAYPKRGGSNSKADALKAWRARIKDGEDFALMTDGASRYASHIESAGKLRTEFVMQAARFYGPGKHYLNDWTPVAAPQQSNAPTSKAGQAIVSIQGLINGLDNSRDWSGIPEAHLLVDGSSTRE